MEFSFKQFLEIERNKDSFQVESLAESSFIIYIKEKFKIEKLQGIYIIFQEKIT